MKSDFQYEGNKFYLNTRINKMKSQMRSPNYIYDKNYSQIARSMYGNFCKVIRNYSGLSTSEVSEKLKKRENPYKGGSIELNEKVILEFELGTSKIPEWRPGMGGFAFVPPYIRSCTLTEEIGKICKLEELTETFLEDCLRYQNTAYSYLEGEVDITFHGMKIGIPQLKKKHLHLIVDNADRK